MRVYTFDDLMNTWFDKPIAFNRGFVTLTKSINAALMLSQAMYWSKRTKVANDFFYKSAKDWEEETGLTRREQEGARKILKTFPFWEEQLKGMPAVVHYKIHKKKLWDSLHEVCELGSTEAPNQFAPNSQTTLYSTDSTSENTPKDTFVTDVYKYFILIRQRCNFKGEIKINPARHKLVIGRKKDGATLEDFKAVINFKFHQWCNDAKMREHLTPETLFRPSNFFKYLEGSRNQPSPDWTDQAGFNDSSTDLY
jgi:uncharacterized phage protein (TIGR02220 family)